MISTPPVRNADTLPIKGREKDLALIPATWVNAIEGEHAGR